MTVRAVTTAGEPARRESMRGADGEGRRQGFLRRYRLPLALAAIALSLYVSSILYIVFVRGQIG